MNSVLGDFILTGSIKGLVIGQPIDLSKGEWIGSLDVYENGKPKFYKFKSDGTTVDVGVTDDDKATYLVVHLDDQEEDEMLRIGDCSVSAKNITLDELIAFFETAHIAWRFKTIGFEKIIILEAEETKVEFIYSFYPGERGLNTIQISS
jgi:hypothetical protein